MLKIYAVPVSLYCAKLRVVLRHKELDWTEVAPPGGYGSEEYKAIVPAGNLPALDHEGLLLADSEAIAEYLNETFPEPEMLPGDVNDRAKARERSRFHDTRLEPAVRMLFALIAKEKRNAEFVDSQWTIVQTRLEQCEALLPETIDNLTLGDCGYPITCAWIDALAKRFSKQPPFSIRVRAYLDQVEKHPAVSAELAAYRPRLDEWLSTQ